MAVAAALAAFWTSSANRAADDALEVSIVASCAATSSCASRPPAMPIAALVLTRDGARITEPEGTREETVGTPAGFEASVATLMASTPFRLAGHRTTPGGDERRPSWTLTVTSTFYRVRTVVVPQPERGVVDGGGVTALQRWIAETARRAELARRIEPERRRALHDRLETLARVRFRANGCYGWCPRYVVHFEADGLATLETPAAFGGPALLRHGRVPFADVVRLLERSRADTLAPEYPSRAVDTFGASLALVYRNGDRFVVNAPDWTTWSPRLKLLEARIGRLVESTAWTPPLPTGTSLVE